MITIGADPEVFLQNNAGKPVSSIGKIGGTKDAPIPIRDGISLQEDNVTVEYNIPPCSTAKDFLTANQAALEIIAERAKAMGLGVKITSAVRMPAAELEDPRAWVFGCEPDFNVWDMDFNPKPEAGMHRAAGGHIHIGVDLPNTLKFHLVKLLDSTLGALLALVDEDTLRKRMYGSAGSMRLKDYGIEYRTASNVWLTHPVLTKTAFYISKSAAEVITQHGEQVTVELSKAMINAINKRNVRLLKEHLMGLRYTPWLEGLPNKVITAANASTQVTEKGRYVFNKAKFYEYLDVIDQAPAPSNSGLNYLAQKQAAFGDLMTIQPFNA